MSNPEKQSHDYISLKTPEGLTARVNKLGAYIEHLTTPNGQELFFPRQMLDGRNRGGMHLCAPIFGPGEAVGLPQHGFARDLTWDEIPTGDLTSVRLMLLNPGGKDPRLAESTYAKLNTHLEVRVSSHKEKYSLQTTLFIHNNDNFGSNFDATISPGFHPYFPAGTTPETGLTVLYDDGSKKFDPADLAQAVTLPENPLDEFSFTNGIHNITIQTPNMKVPVLWSAHPDQYFCVEPTYAGAITADPDAALPEHAKLSPQFARGFFMQIDWEPVHG